MDKEGQRIDRIKRGHYNDDKDNSPNILSDKNCETISSSVFMMRILCCNSAYWSSGRVFANGPGD